MEETDLTNRVPTSALALMRAVYFKIFPVVDRELAYWTKRAKQIPDDELRSQALASIAAKRFHCQGGAVYALLAGEKLQEAIRFIVAYQTISDYLDNLCDRSTSMDPMDFRLLHQSMADALTPGKAAKNYYKLRKEQKDGGYLAALVNTCQQTLGQVESCPVIKRELLELQTLYEDLQVHKHVKAAERIPRLTNWHQAHQKKWPSLSWYEFSAASGSTLGIFCIVAYAFSGKMTAKHANKIRKGYFPYMQGLHILLDYYIDQQEDKEEGDLNFCFYYPNQRVMKKRFISIIKQTNNHVQDLPDRKFHAMIQQGLVGLYLGDPKVKNLDGSGDMAKELLRQSGVRAKFFHWNAKMYNKIKG